ncbi:MAG TPA: hypothetical protein VGR28_10450 [Candidatus Thermoplasmatota archaeon]|jgi:hypothetical protein|nr:hypothetical protein [Candidatus Thermoplasmatota archaeon]
MLPRAIAVILLLGLLAASLPAWAQQMDQPGTKSGRVNPGGFLETNLQLHGGDRIAWRLAWNPSGERAFYDIHTHEGPRVIEYDNGTVACCPQGAFTVPKDGIYSWLIENIAYGGVLEASILTERAGGNGAPSSTPAAPWGLVVLALAVASLAARRGARP